MSHLLSRLHARPARFALSSALSLSKGLSKGLAVGLLVTACSAELPGNLISTSVAPASMVSEFVASGFTEADETAVSSELGGRITALPADEGADVRAGDVLVQLDTGSAEAQLRVAQSKVQAAEAALAVVKAGARAEEVRQAEAGVALAQANLLAADQARRDAGMLLSQQQTLDLQIIQANAQVEVSRNQLNTAVANQAAVQTVTDRTKHEDAPFQDYQTWDAWIGVNSAGAAYDGARTQLQKLQEERRRSASQVAQLHQAESTFQEAQSAVAQAQAKLADLRSGATAEQILVAQAQVAIAEAGVQAAQASLKKLTLVAPVNGQVLEHNLKVGELAAPGAAILTLADLDTLNLVVYVPADRLGLVRLNAQVTVQADSFPNRTFAGEVVHVADQAVFLPDNVQSAEDRATMVFEVKLRLANPDHALKPGMPADAHFQEP